MDISPLYYRYTKAERVLTTYFFAKDVNRTYRIFPIFMLSRKILSLLWSFLLKTHAHNSLFIFWGLLGHFASQCANCSDVGPRSLLGCLPLPAASVFTYLVGSLRAVLKVLSASFKTRPQGVQPKSKSPRSVTPKTLPWSDSDFHWHFDAKSQATYSLNWGYVVCKSVNSEGCW